MLNEEYHPEKLLRYIGEEDPDIVCLQELDWGNERTKSIDVLQYLSDGTGMKGFFGIEFFELDASHRPKKLSGGGVHGNGILTKPTPESVYRIELPEVFVEWENPSRKIWALQKSKRPGLENDLPYVPILNLMISQ